MARMRLRSPEAGHPPFSAAACSPAITFRYIRRNASAMRNVSHKNSLPAGSEYLCRRCSWGQCIMGYRESDCMVICTNCQPNVTVPFPVMECSGFHDKHRPNWSQMQKLAIDIQPVRLSARTAGFSAASETASAATPQQDTDREDEAAFVRWIITSLAEKDPGRCGGRGYIW